MTSDVPVTIKPHKLDCITKYDRHFGKRPLLVNVRNP